MIQTHTLTETRTSRNCKIISVNNLERFIGYYLHKMET